MISIILLAAAVIGATTLWPINRYVSRRGDRLEVYAFWGCLTTTVISGCLAVALGQTAANLDLWLSSVVIGVSFVVGYWIVIMYCLKIGPAGPTTAMNNMGLLWPVVLGAVWIKPHPINYVLATGVGLVCASLMMMGVGRQGSAKSVSVKWLMWGLLGWALAGICFTGQLWASIRVPESPAALVAAYNVVGAAILFPLAVRGKGLFASKPALVGGMASGLMLAIAGIGIQMALRYVGPEVVYPITLGLPVVFVLLLGRFVYREQLNWNGWLACGLGLAGLVFLSVGQAATR